MREDGLETVIDQCEHLQTNHALLVDDDVAYTLPVRL
jgi:hypothetical protein